MAISRAAARIPLWNQTFEGAADTEGCINTLNTGRARRPQYQWSENGGILLLDYFTSLETAAGGGLFNPSNLLKTHPFPSLRLLGIRTVIAPTWHAQHPG